MVQKGFALTWTETDHVKWKLPLPGSGHSSPIVSKGRVFVAGCVEADKARVLYCADRKTGKLLWVAKLPAGGYATPATYLAKGRQYLVIACGGGKCDTKPGDAYVAFALPK